MCCCLAASGYWGSTRSNKITIAAGGRTELAGLCRSSSCCRLLNRSGRQHRRILDRRMPFLRGIRKTTLPCSYTTRPPAGSTRFGFALGGGLGWSRLVLVRMTRVEDPYIVRLRWSWTSTGTAGLRVLREASGSLGRGAIDGHAPSHAAHHPTQKHSQGQNCRRQNSGAVVATPVAVAICVDANDIARHGFRSQHRDAAESVGCGEVAVAQKLRQPSAQ